MKKTYPGNAANSSSAVVHTADYRVIQEARREAEHLEIKLLVLPTTEAVKVLEQDLKDTNAIRDMLVVCEFRPLFRDSS